MKPLSFKRQRFHPDVIRQAVCLYFRFTQSLRDVEDLVTERGVDVTYETICCWVDKFGPTIAANIRKRRGRADYVWHLDEIIVRINDQRSACAIGADGEQPNLRFGIRSRQRYRWLLAQELSGLRWADCRLTAMEWSDR